MLDVQLVLLAPFEAGNDLLAAALDRGIDVLGGCPHLAPDPDAETLRLLDFAETAGLPLDLHTDEQLDPTMLSVRTLAAEVSRRGLHGRVAASHCVSLGSLDPPVLQRVVEEIADAEISVVTLPITNLYLQGRASGARAPRGITALRALLDAGVVVAAGADNVRDAFNPMGRSDPFETTSLLVTAGHLDAPAAFGAVTGAGRQVLGLPAAGPVVGARADLLAVEAASLSDVVAGAGRSRLVLKAGRVVAHTTVRTSDAITDLAEAHR